MTRTRRPLLARQAARLTAVVVFAHPPFWLTSAITRADSECATLPSRAAAECRRRWLSRPAGAPSGPQEPGQPPVYGIDHRGHGRILKRPAPAKRAAHHMILADQSDGHDVSARRTHSGELTD